MDNIIKNKYTKEDINVLFKNEMRNHYLKREGSIGTTISEYKNEDKNIEVSKEEKVPGKLKYKFMLKLVGCLFIATMIMAYKYTNNENIKNNLIVKWIKEEYNKDYTRQEVLENVEDLSKSVYSKVNDIIPQELHDKIVNSYINKIKPEILNFSMDGMVKNIGIDNTVAVFNEDDIEISDEIVKAEEAVTTSSQISLMDMDKEEILAKNININLPVEGTITSIYGARDEVFENVGYHTGIDIANVLNTPIKSATDGVVVSTVEMDKYYGNNIEIEQNGVIFKYAHLNEIKVNKGDEIKQGDIIGLMGSTGMSTGSHLHFEIKINDRSVDPELLLKFR